jgi:hypothetical protein
VTATPAATHVTATHVTATHVTATHVAAAVTASTSAMTMRESNRGQQCDCQGD